MRKLDLSIIKTLCQKNNISLKEFADKIGTSLSSVSHTIKNNKTTTEFLEKASAFFCVSVDTFFKIDNNSASEINFTSKSIKTIIKNQSDEVVLEIKDHLLDNSIMYIHGVKYQTSGSVYNINNFDGIVKIIWVEAFPINAITNNII